MPINYYQSKYNYFKSQIPMIYCVISQQQQLLTDFTIKEGNFKAIVQTILSKIDFTKQYSQFATDKYKFYVLNKKNITFLVHVQQKYEMVRVYKFLRIVSDKFFQTFGANPQNDFKPILQELMSQFNQNEVDKLSLLKKELEQLQKITEQNLKKVMAKIAQNKQLT